MRGPQNLSPRARFAFLAKDTAIYGFGEALSRGLAIMTFPILARSFSVADFGTIDYLTACVVLIVVVLVFGQDSAVARYFFESEETETRRQTVSQSFSYQVLLLVAVLPPAWLFADSIAIWLGLETQEGEMLVRLMILQTPFFVFVNFSQSLLKWTFQRGRFLTMTVGTTAATMVGLLAATTLSELSIEGVFIIYLSVRAIFGLLGLWFVRSWLTVPTGWDRLKPLLSFAAPFGVICVIASFLPVLERSMVGSLLGPEALGLYAAGAKVAMLMMLVINAIETSWGPFSLSIYKESDAAHTYNHVLQAVSLFLFTLVLGLSAFADTIVSILGSSRYQGAGVVTFGLAFGLAINAISSVSSVGIVISKRAYLKLAGYGTLLVVAMVAIPSLTWLLGISGAAWGSMLAMLAKTLVETWLAQRAHPLSWSFSAPLLLGSLTAVVGAVHQTTFGLIVVSGVSIVPLFGIALLGIVAWFVVLSRSERAQFSCLVGKKLKMTGQ